MTAGRSPTGTGRAAELIGRFDRLPGWPFSPLVLAVIALGFLFVFYDIFTINVSFVQTCERLRHGCTPHDAFGALTTPLLWNLGGYVAGAVALGPLCDRTGRRTMLMLTMLVTGLGSAYTALAGDLTNFTVSRAITGAGIGADLTVISTYLGEVAPRDRRARTSSLIFLAANAGATAAIWLGLVLTTPAGRWPAGLPFAQAGPGFEDGWRWMYRIGAILALVAVVLRYELPESPRWLIGRGLYAQAERLIEGAESRALRRSHVLTGTGTATGTDAGTRPGGSRPEDGPWSTYAYLFGHPAYRRRLLILLAMWTTAYVTVYALAGGLTSLLTALGHPQAEAGMISAVGILGLFVARLANPLADRFPRRLWLPLSAVIMLAGAVVLTLGGSADLPAAFAGAVLLFVGNSLWTPVTYTWTAEHFPTRARASGFALVDGLGHLGGGVGVLLIAPLVPRLGALGGLLLVVAFLAAAAVIAQFNVPAHGRSLEAVSPDDRR